MIRVILLLDGLFGLGNKIGVVNFVDHNGISSQAWEFGLNSYAILNFVFFDFLSSHPQTLAYHLI